MSLPPVVCQAAQALIPDATAAQVWGSLSAAERGAATRLIDRAGLNTLLKWRLGSPASDPKGHAMQLAIADLVEAIPNSVLLKGADLASRAYPRAELRSMTDVDVLVRRAELADTERSVAELGYVPDRNEGLHHRRWFRAEPFGVSLEIHHELFNPPHGLDLNMDAVFLRTSRVPLAIDGLQGRVLHPADAAVHVAAHGAYSDTYTTPTAVLRSLVDLRWLQHSTGVRASDIWARAMEWGVDAAVETGVRWLADLDGERLRPGRNRSIRERAGQKLLMRNARAACEPGGAWMPAASMTRALLAPGALEMVRVLWGHGWRSIARTR